MSLRPAERHTFQGEKPKTQVREPSVGSLPRNYGAARHMLLTMTNLRDHKLLHNVCLLVCQVLVWTWKHEERRSCVHASSALLSACSCPAWARPAAWLPAAGAAAPRLRVSVPLASASRGCSMAACASARSACVMRSCARAIARAATSSEAPSSCRQASFILRDRGIAQVVQLIFRRQEAWWGSRAAASLQYQSALCAEACAR